MPGKRLAEQAAARDAAGHDSLARSRAAARAKSTGANQAQSGGSPEEA
ncbi:MAG: hypothetical protein ACI867_001773 [Glaciecola sp.]|jgi:hypothetical protein